MHGGPRAAVPLGSAPTPRHSIGAPMPHMPAYRLPVGEGMQRHSNGRVSASKGRSVMWMDVDAGVDDAQGILMALEAEHADVLGISLVHGNVGVDQVAKNVARILTLAHRQDIPFYVGAGEPLLPLAEPMDAVFFHGRDGLGDVPDVQPSADSITLQPHEGLGVIKLLEAARQHAGQLIVVATGPLTNVALACKLDPQFVSNVRALYVMGGAERSGNSSVAAEYNFHCDPEAAQLVLLKFPVTTLVTWECTIAHAVPWDYVQIWEALTTPKGSFMTAVMAKSLAYERGRTPMPAGWIACDPLAVALAAEHDRAEGNDTGSSGAGDGVAPLLQESTMIHCAVELNGAITRGQCVFDWNAAGRAEPNVRLVTKVDLERFAELLHDSML